MQFHDPCMHYEYFWFQKRPFEENEEKILNYYYLNGQFWIQKCSQWGMGNIRPELGNKKNKMNKENCLQMIKLES